LFKTETVVDLRRIEKALGGVSTMTAFRYLKQVPYRRSYNHNGCYYCLHEPSRYDRLGLWTWRDVHFSRDGSLRKTVCRLVREQQAGATQRELQEQLKVRVHNTLLDLLRNGEVARERLVQVYVYLHVDRQIREVQIMHRQALLEAQDIAVTEDKVEAGDAVVIQVLLTLLRHPGARVADAVRYLRGHSPPITLAQVALVFDRYELDHIGKKGGASNY
jgi:hypothetical protein